MRKAIWFFHLGMSKSRKELDISVACSKSRCRICTGVCLLCVFYVHMDMVLPLPSPQKSLEKGSLKKKKCFLRLALKHKKDVVFFSFVKGKLKDHGILKVRTAKPD